MSDMLAAPLDAGAGSRVIAALSGGKQEAKGIPGDAGGEDPFVAVLFSKLNVLAGQGADGAEQLPLQPLEQALPAARRPPGDVGQAEPLSQAVLAAAVVLGQTPASAAGVEADVFGVAADKGARKAAPAKSMGLGVGAGTALAMAANAKAGAAEAAADGQLLPPGREDVGLPRQSRVDLSPAALPAAAASTVLQGLAAQFQAAGTEAAGVVSAQTGHALAAGVGHGMGVMADMQGRSTAAGVQLSIDVPVRSPLFPQELGDRIVWLSARQGQVADIALNPPHLGPLEVKLSLSGGEAGAQFFSPHAQVRDAIEAALPRLREMMADAGVTLGQTQVRDEAFPRQDSLAQGEGRAHAAGVPEAGAQQLQTEGAARYGVRGLARGLVDVFA